VAESERPVWLSGAVLTPLNKYILPSIWTGALAALLISVLATTGRIRIAPGFEFLAAATVAATAFMLWFSSRLQRVGYCGRELVISNYWREARVPFEQVAAVEPVWWYRRRLVRFRFYGSTPFGSTVYYLPKWVPLRLVLPRPDEELRSIIGSPSLTPR